ncbi:transcription initiation factor TFIID subunit 4-like [Falco biarmicus]|uniref:transcription initiation factor TFIID subunit 4-like n=1 Tax=Falco biarmicus TaxID=345155 RepID=UPI0024BC989C|nr:transcription initiation factor TFIID subunit 4-like [Falco biarmicus]
MIRIFPDFSVQVTAAAAGGAAGGVPAAPGMGRAGAAANGNPQNVQGITSYQQRRGDRFAGRERHVVLSRHPPPPSSSSTPPAPPAALPAPWYRRRGTRGRAAAIPPAAAHVHNGRTCAARGGRQLPPANRGCAGGPGRSAQSYAGPRASCGQKPSGPWCADGAPQPNFQVLR